MTQLMQTIEHLFHTLVSAGILLLEFAGVAVLLATAVRCIIGIFHKDAHVRLKLAQGIALSLEFKLGGEVLRTVIVREWSELAILGAIILLRGLLTFLIHWEIKNEESRLKLDVHQNKYTGKRAARGAASKKEKPSAQAE